jgi:putative ABC transport system permease protein
MGHNPLSPRWRKIARDLWIDKTRTALVVLSLVIGVFTVGFLLNNESALRINFNRQFAAVNPSSARLVIPDGFDDKFVQSVRRMAGIQDAEGRRSTTVRLSVGTNQWVNINISAISDFRDIRLDKIEPVSGA